MNPTTRNYCNSPPKAPITPVLGSIATSRKMKISEKLKNDYKKGKFRIVCIKTWF
jgi:hypothetical protein